MADEDLPYPDFASNPVVQANAAASANRSGGGKANANESQQLQFVDYNSLVAPFIDFKAAFDFAQGIGRENADTYYKNLNSQRTKDTALSFVDTDIQGILKGLNSLVPRARSEGNQDTETNIARAGRIDQYNFSRLPQFNEFNRGQVAQNNAFNRSEREKSIEASGIDYRSRVTKVLNQLDTQSEGRMSDPLLDTLITSTNRDRGADIGAASGISGYSGAGVNIQDKLDVNQRIGLALDAQKTLPGVAAQAQSILQPPEEQLRTVTSVPTNVPLNASNIGDRVPIQSSVSAGAAQASIGTQATDIETIPAETALQSRLQTDQYNETGKYTRDLTVLDRNQGQLTAQDSEDLRAGLQDKADSQNAQQLEAYYAGLDARSDANRLNALTTAGGAFLGSSTGQAVAGYVGSQIADFLGFGNSGDVVDTSAGNGFGAGDIVDSVLNPANYPTGGGSGAETAATGGNDSFDVSTTLPNTSGGAGSSPPSISSQGGSSGGSGSYNSTGDSGGATNFFAKTAIPLPDSRQDAQTILDTAATASRFQDMTPSQQVQASGSVGTRIAVSQGLVNPERGAQIQSVNQDVGTLLNPGSTSGQRGAALANMSLQARGTTFAGPITNPSTIGNVPVTGQVAMPDGTPGFQLADGNTVSQQSLVNGSNGVAAVNAFGVVTSNADTETKIAALTSIGVGQAAANQIVNSVAAGNGMAALSIFSTGKNFSQMNPVEQSAAITQTGGATYNAIANSLSQGIAPNTGASILGGPTTSAVAGAVPYIPLAAYTAETLRSQTIPVLKGDKSYGDALKDQLPGAVMIGDALNGGGRSTGRKLRDSWNSNLQSMEIADDDYNVDLADGSKYNIGLDDGDKLTNAAGKERNPYDIDLDSKLARNSIPDAHLFAIATGLDPTSNSKADLWHRATGKGVNAATSNANTPEEVSANFKAMMKDIDPNALSARVETLRVTNKINDQEYGVYLDRINKMYGTKIAPQDRQKSTNTLVAQLKSAPNASKAQKELLALLTNPRKLAANLRATEERLA